MFFATDDPVSPTGRPLAATRQLVDSGSSVASISLGFDGDGNPGIAYGLSGMRYARHNGTSWIIEEIDRSASPSDLAFDWNGRPAIVYTAGNGNSPDVRLARRTPTGWSIEVVKARADPFSGPSLAFDNTGSPVVVYNAGAIVYIARRAGTGWTVSVLESGPGSFGLQPDIAYDRSSDSDPLSVNYNRPVVAYMSEPPAGLLTPRRLLVSRADGTASVVVDTDASAWRPWQLMETANPASAYIGAGGEDLRFAHHSAGAWNVQTSSQRHLAQDRCIPHRGFLL